MPRTLSAKSSKRVYRKGLKLAHTVKKENKPSKTKNMIFGILCDGHINTDERPLWIAGQKWDATRRWANEQRKAMKATKATLTLTDADKKRIARSTRAYIQRNNL
jgi:hypothetical protein